MFRHFARVAAFLFAAAVGNVQAATDIVVDTTEPFGAFARDGKCSVYEALKAANDEATFLDCAVVNQGPPYRVILQPGQTYAVDQARDTSSGRGDNFFVVQWIYEFVYNVETRRTTATRRAPHIEIVGNGATIERPDSAPKFRFFAHLAGTFTIRDLTLRGGDATGADFGFALGGAIEASYENGQLNVDRVTFDRNRAGSGSAIYAYDTEVNVLSSTFTNGEGQGALVVGEKSKKAVNVANSTFENGADIGMSPGSTSRISLSHNSFLGLSNYFWGNGRLVARGNVMRGYCQFEEGSVTVTASGNVGHASCPVVAGNLSTLLPIADNGGPTPTAAFTVPSALQGVDADCRFASSGTNPLFSDGAPITTDQRGAPRTPGACDAGAYQYTSLSVAALPAASQGLPYAALLAGAGGAPDYAFALEDGPSWLDLDQLGPAYTLRGTPPAGHGTTVDVLLKIADATGFASYGIHPLFIGAGVPGAPTLTGNAFDAGAGTSTVSFAPPADDGGSPITGYVVRCPSTGYQSPSSLVSPLVFDTPTGTHTGCAVVAVNGLGSSPPSAGSFGMSATLAIVTGMSSASPMIVPPGALIDIAVTFNRPVTQVATDDFDLVVTGDIQGAVVTGISGNGSDYFARVYAGTGGYGTLTLNFVDVDSVFDGSLVPVGGTGIGNGDFPGKTYTVAIPPPAPTITQLAPGDSAITVAFDAPASDGGLPITGYVATCNPGATTGSSVIPSVHEITVPVVNGETYACTVAAVNGAGTGTPSAPMSVEVPSVSVTGIRRGSKNPTAPGSVVQYDVTFTHDVTGVDATDFVLVTTGLTGAAITGVLGYGGLYTVIVNTGSGVGTLRLDMVDDDSIRDASAPLNGIGTGTDTISPGDTFLVNDRPSSPAITNIFGSDSQATIFFDPPDNDGGHPIVEYEAACGAPPPGPTGSARVATSPIVVPLVNGWSYLCQVVAITSAGVGVVSAPEAVTLALTGVAGITRASADPAYGATVDYTVTFDHFVTGVDATDFTLAVTGLTGASIVNVTGPGPAFTVTVNRGTGAGTLRLDLVADGSIHDASAPLAVVGGVFQGESYTILAAPSVTSMTAVGATTTPDASVQVDVTFSGSVTGVDASDFTLVTGGGIVGASIASVTGSGSTRRVSVNTGTGNGTIRLDLVDDDTITDGTPLGGPGTGNGNAQGPVFTLDRNAPVVQSIVVSGGNPGTVRSGTTLTYEITLSRNVTGVDAADFVATLTGSAAATMGSFSGSGALFRVDVTLTGSGTVRLDAVDDDSIVDIVGNPLGGTGVGNGAFIAGAVVTVDGTAPTVTSITRAAGTNVTAGTSAGFTVRFSESVTGVDAGDFALVATGTAAGTIDGVTGNGDTYTVTVSFTSGIGTLRLDLVDDDSVVDTVLNPLGGTGAGNGNAQGEAYDLVAVQRSTTGSTPTGTGPVTASFTGGGPGCTFVTSRFIPLAGDPGSPPAGSAPPGLQFPHGLFDFSLAGCTPGSTVTLSITYPTALPASSRYWKYGPTTGLAAHWYTVPASIVGDTITFSVTDGGLGVDDLTADGSITDAGGVALAVAVASSAHGIPTLSEGALWLLSLALLALGVRSRRWATRPRAARDPASPSTW